ncbi:hypothetical protein [Streptomyces sp. NPDC048196]|uniref:hypothetical protein n=1 Tax=Streptomyces sp. NPDC048196 TaxID=3154712 RepID=UPI003411E4F8
MGEPTELFTELARALVQALDAWAATVGQATDIDKRPTRAGLIAELERGRRELEGLGQNRKKIDEPLLAYWLKGRDQLLVGRKRNRLPSEEDSAAIARVLSEKACRSAAQLPRISTEIADLSRRLKNEGGIRWRDEVLASLTRGAGPSGNREPDSSPTSMAVPSAAAECQGTPSSPQTRTGYVTQIVSSTGTMGQDASPSPPLTTSGNSHGAPPPDGRQWSRREQRSWDKALGSAVAVVVTAAALITALVVATSNEDVGTESGVESDAPHRLRPTGSAPPAQGTLAEASMSPPGMEKGALGEDSRCSAPFQGPNAITWRVCTRVESDRVSFALKITNHSRAEATVKAHLEYAQATKFHRCPNAPHPQQLSVPAGKTLITDPRQCTAPRNQTPFAYQGVGWVLPEGATAGSYELSPTAHVHPDRVIWKPDLV